jgi:hypothetical protein
MKNEGLNKMSDEQLLKYQKTLRIVTYMLIVAILALLVINILKAIEKGVNSFSIIPIALVPIAIVNFKTLREIKKEIVVRNLK